MHTKTLRDEFAMAALGGLLSDQREGSAWSAWEEPELTRRAYLYADAMLEARDAIDPPVEVGDFLDVAAARDLQGELVPICQELVDLGVTADQIRRLRAVLAKLPAEVTTKNLKP